MDDSKIYIEELMELKDAEKSATEIFGEEVVIAAKNIVRMIKAEGMTYQEAYQALSATYDLIKYQTNFLKLNS